MASINDFYSNYVFPTDYRDLYPPMASDNITTMWSLDEQSYPLTNASEVKYGSNNIMFPERLGVSTTINIAEPTPELSINSGLCAISGFNQNLHPDCYESLQCNLSPPDIHPVYAGSSDAWAVHSLASAEEPSMKICRYSEEERKDRIVRYLNRQNQRNFNITIKYAHRKILADQRTINIAEPTPELSINSGLCAISGFDQNLHPDCYESLGQCNHFPPDIHPVYAGSSDAWAVHSLASAEEPSMKIRRYSEEERKDRIVRYLDKRNRRNFNKTIKYAQRKTLADRRIRVRGRFARNNDVGQESKEARNSKHCQDKEEYYDDDAELQTKHNGEEWLQEDVAVQCNSLANVEEPSMKIRRYTVEERKDRIVRYLNKRNRRNFNKTIKYACRKTLADRRIRVRGRFARNNDVGKELKEVRNNKHCQDEEEYYDDDAELQMKHNGEEWLQEAVASLMYLPIFAG